MSEFDEAWRKAVRSRTKPNMDTAVKLCKIRGTTEVNVLFEIFEKLLHEWYELHDYSQTWSD